MTLPLPASSAAPVAGADLVAPDGEPAIERPAVRPQTLLLTFLSNHMHSPDDAIFTGSLIGALGRMDVAEHAARSTVSRMIRRGLLSRHRRGKRIYLHLSAEARAILADGEARVRASAVNRSWSGEWTLLGFSLPESRRADRHQLRSRLTWAGFGLLQNGLWIAAREVDVPTLLERVDVLDHVNVFRARTVEPTQVAQLIDDAWDLGALRRNYEDFLRRWDVPEPLPQARDDLARELWLHSEWLLLVRQDPGLPVDYLPADWPAVRAEHVALRLRRAYAPGAQAEASKLIERVSLSS